MEWVLSTSEAYNKLLVIFFLPTYSNQEHVIPTTVWTLKPPEKIEFYGLYVVNICHLTYEELILHALPVRHTLPEVISSNYRKNIGLANEITYKHKNITIVEFQMLIQQKISNRILRSLNASLWVEYILNT